MSPEEFGNNQIISDYIYQNKESIPIIDVVKVTKDSWGRLDIIIFEYCDGKMEFLPILMDFNKIANPFTVPIGTLINIPDYQYIIESIKTNTVFNADNNDDVNIPGVSNSMACITQNKLNIKQGVNKNSDKTIGIPKLNVTLKKVNYDSSTGIITY